MKPSAKNRRPTPAPPQAVSLTDYEAAFELGVGLTTLRKLQRHDPDFPRPLYLRPRLKRHDRAALAEYRRLKAGAAA